MAGTILLRFETCEQLSQEDTSTDEHTVCRVFFSVVAKGQHYPGLFVDIRQPAGGEADKEPIEVGLPQGTNYLGPWNPQAFRTAVEIYFRRFTSAWGARKEGSGGLVANRRTYRMPMKIEFDGSGPDTSW